MKKFLYHLFTTLFYIGVFGTFVAMGSEPTSNEHLWTWTGVVVGLLLSTLTLAYVRAKLMEDL
jgi:hypothetical protein